MKKYIIAFITLVVILFNFDFKVDAQTKKVVYFYVTTCDTCNKTTPYVESLVSQGIEVIKYDITQHGDLFYDYAASYYVPVDLQSVPMLFVGDRFFHAEDIIENIENNTIQNLSDQPLNEIIDNDMTNFSIFALIGFALVDGVNPCAMAMLLLFISLLGFTSKKSTLIKVSLSYISALFISYFLLGTVLYNVLYLIKGSWVIFYINILIMILAFILFIYNMNDYFVSKNEEYGKIKNQLPKVIQKFNKKIMKKFTKHLNEQSPYIYIITFGLGFTISLTEFLCTGQVYLAFITSMIHFSDSFNYSSIFYLLLYNFIFVLPLILIALVAIKTKSTIGTSDYIRRNLHKIKLINAILFLIVFLNYLNYLFNFTDLIKKWLGW